MRRWLIAGAVLWLAAGTAFAQNNQCDQPGEEPDVIVGAIYAETFEGTVGDISGFAIGTESCNIGTCWAEWFSGTPGLHPVIGQNMFRHKDGRFEQIGQAWLKHSFATLDGNECSNQCIPGGGQHLGVNCSDPYGPGLNSQQTSLGPKFQVQPGPGTHAHPYFAQGQTGNAIYKKLQVHNDDLTEALNPGAQYWFEAQYVTHDDAAAGNNANNNSYRRTTISDSPGPPYNATLQGTTVREKPAIFAWRDVEPAVQITSFNGGEYLVGASATDLGGGTWRYEYAIQNVIFDEAIREFQVPIPHGAVVTNVGFHDVDYHSGEPYDGTDWSPAVTGGAGLNTVGWATQFFFQNPDANAIRWGTLYNFRFDVNAPPVTRGPARIDDFDGPGGLFEIQILVPDRCNDGFCDTDETDVSCPIDCLAGTSPSGTVPDGVVTPGQQLIVTLAGTGNLDMSWGASCVLDDLDYEIYEGKLGNFVSHEPAVCSTGGATAATITPSPRSSYYLVVPTNGGREGSYGVVTGGAERPQGAGSCRTQEIQACD